MEQQLARWKLTALLAIAVLIGYVAGQWAPAASAQGSVVVQPDTTRCMPDLSLSASAYDAVTQSGSGWVPTSVAFDEARGVWLATGFVCF
jgi:hypothetical protein